MSGMIYVDSLLENIEKQLKTLEKKAQDSQLDVIAHIKSEVGAARAHIKECTMQSAHARNW